jgi:hypothetical protein
VDVVTISAEGDTAETHDAFRHRSGLFGRILQAIDEMAARRKRGHPRMQVRCTMNRLNFREMASILDNPNDARPALAPCLCLRCRNHLPGGLERQNVMRGQFGSHGAP